MADLAPFFRMGMMRALLLRNIVVEEADAGASIAADRLLSAFLEGVGA
jgi:hypothetical protein